MKKKELLNSSCGIFISVIRPSWMDTVIYIKIYAGIFCLDGMQWIMAGWNYSINLCGNGISIQLNDIPVSTIILTRRACMILTLFDVKSRSRYATKGVFLKNFKLFEVKLACSCLPIDTEGTYTDIFLWPELGISISCNSKYASHVSKWFSGFWTLLSNTFSPFSSQWLQQEK